MLKVVTYISALLGRVKNLGLDINWIMMSKIVDTLQPLLCSEKYTDTSNLNVKEKFPSGTDERTYQNQALLISIHRYTVIHSPLLL